MLIDSSLKGRFVSKLTSNVMSALLGIITVALVPRTLGPADYGRFEFLAANFKLILDSITCHAPSAFFNWISRKAHKEDADVSVGVTLYLVTGSVLFFCLLIAVATMTGFHVVLWPDIAPLYLWEGFGLTLAVFLFQMCTYMADGKALTGVLEKLRLVQNLAKTGAYLLLIWASLMNLHTFFFSQIVITGAVALIMAGWLYRRRAFTSAALMPWHFPKDEIKRYLSFLKAFVRPLVILVVVGFLFSYFDRWFLQLIGGAAQYGYFGLSDRLGAVAFLFTSAMTPLLTREFAFAFEEMDKARLRSLFERIRVFLFIAVVTSCFLSMNSASLVEVIGGKKFIGAVIPITIMTLYPIHQTFGQLSGALLIATGQTGLYSKISLFCMVASIPFTYLLMAPTTYLIPGLALGATGLAIKMVVVNIVGTNIQLYYNTKFLGISFPKWIFLQVKTVGIVYGAAAVACFLSLRLPDSFIQPFSFVRIDPAVFTAAIRLGLSGLLYLLFVFALVVAAPGLAGVGRDELKQIVRQTFWKRRSNEQG
ncbi:MAG: lipopolysaccharide biosynthesis protein [Deltaproteobacteria bacterium]|nr:lipopolysaccharide biosynthesis protein [Deltaproteobacteria bacterium]